MLMYCPNCSRDLFFANHMQFAKFAKIRSSRKFCRLQSFAFTKLKPNLRMLQLHAEINTHKIAA
ncbi:MAG: hypothetical protein PV344_08030, partial [Anaplasma sp.]|nr:hypothetical protein [Anaplasma sp.]